MSWDLTQPTGLGGGTSTDRIQHVPGAVIIQGWHHFYLFTDEKMGAEVGSGLDLPGAGTQPRAPGDGASPRVGCCYKDESWLVTGPVSFRRNFYILLYPQALRRVVQSFRNWGECLEFPWTEGLPLCQGGAGVVSQSIPSTECPWGTGR